MVTIIDRTGEKQEFKYDQRIYSFKKDQLVLPLDVATWLFRSGNHHVHTTTGEFVRRYGVVDAPEDWVTEMGVEVLDTTPLTRDRTRLEGWDAEGLDPLRTRATVVDLRATANRPRQGDYVNQGS